MPSDSDSDLALDFAADYLEAVAAGGSVDLAAICAARADLIPQVESLLRDGGHLAEAAGKFALHADVDAEPMPDSLGRYQLMNVLGEGGMGIAFRGRDPELNRDVAVKLLRARVAHSPNSAKRFLDEARITAQLQHPTIPAVHELGTHPDGRPWMAMKLIKGDTLAALLATDSQSLNRLTVFESICQGLSYAHSKGVIHRDLKPQNIMVGAFGEVQVMDWGLAKVLGATSEPESASDETVGTVIASDRESDGEFTRAGTALGSPAYMPPEQAIGAVNRIDRRSDVFGLGAILCHLLTGKPPFVGADSESTRQLAAMGKVESAFARLDASGTDPEWVALCKRCLAAEAEQRPADAGAVAAEVAGLRAAADERAKLAEVEKAKAEIRMQNERNRRRIDLTWAAALILVLILSGTLALVLGLKASSDRDAALEAGHKEREAKEREMAARDRATTLAREERIANENAVRNLSQLRRNNALLFSLIDDLEGKVDEEWSEQKLGTVLAARIVTASKKLGIESVGDPLTLAEMQHQFGATLLALGHNKDAIDILIRATEVRRVTLGPENKFTLQSMGKLGEAYLADRQLEKASEILIPTSRLKVKSFGPSDIETIGTLEALANCHFEMHRRSEAIALFRSCMKTCGDAHGYGNIHTLNIMNNLGLALLYNGESKEAIAILERTLALKKQTLSRDHPDTLGTQNNVAQAYVREGQLNRAIPILEDLVELTKTKLGIKHRKHLICLNNLAEAYRLDKQSVRAVQIHTAALKLRTDNLGRLHPETIASKNNLALAYRDDGRLDDAIPLLREVLISLETVPDQELLLKSMNSLGSIYCAAGKGDLGERVFEKYFEKVRADQSINPVDLAARLANASGPLLDCGRFITAEKYLRECLELREKHMPDSWSTFNAQAMLGGAFLGQKDYHTAEMHLLKGYAGLLQREKSIPENGQSNLSIAVDRLIVLYSDLKRPEELAKWKQERLKYPMDESKKR